MTRNGRLIAFPLDFGSRLASSLMLGLALGLTWPSHAQAGKLTRFLTSEDLADRVLLDQNGRQLQLSTTAHHRLVLPSGSTPTYLAIPLAGGEHLPVSIPSIVTGSQPGQTTVGPLNFDAQVKAALTTELDKSKLAVVETPDRSYLVEFLPGRASSTSATGPASELVHLLNIGSTQLTRLTQSGMNELDEFLKIRGSKTATAQPSLNLEAQVLGSALPPPIPEPSTWMIFAGLAVGAAVLRRHSRQRG